MKRLSVGAIELEGGGNKGFYFCLLEFYPETNRWFISSLERFKSEKLLSGDRALLGWMNEVQLEHLVVDLPLTLPPCHTCLDSCPGEEQCMAPEIQDVRQKIQHLLEASAGPNYPPDLSYKKNKDQIDLSKSLKRRLKRGLLPYWNRPLDFWVWTQYYDQLLKNFNVAYDSFGQTSLMIFLRFSHLRKKFPSSTRLYESNRYLVLLELLKGKIITQQDIQDLNDIENGSRARLNIIMAVEQKLNLFIYDQDLETFVKNPKAFHAFLLVLAGYKILGRETYALPSWAVAEGANFEVPYFV